MEINALTSGSPYTTSASRKTIDSLSLTKVQNEGALVAGLLPSATATSSSLGGSLDIYAAVGLQSQGLMSRGLLGIQIANISLGIDTSKEALDAAAEDNAAAGDAASTGPGAVDSEPTSSPTEAGHTNTILNGILKADGFEPPEANPYQYAKDYFADQTPPAESTARIYSNPDLSNPSLGGLLNSLG